jgi:hypothetical protein
MAEEFTESTEKIRAQRTPINVRFELVGCEFATPIWDPNADTLFPVFEFRPQCPFGKIQPDQECRMCVHRRITSIGQDALDRYPNQGKIFPIPNQETISAILEVLDQSGALPLQRITRQ